MSVSVSVSSRCVWTTVRASYFTLRVTVTVLVTVPVILDRCVILVHCCRVVINRLLLHIVADLRVILGRRHRMFF